MISTNPNIKSIIEEMPSVIGEKSLKKERKRVNFIGVNGLLNNISS